MKQYGCLQAIFMSFYSGKLYRDVARNWGAGVFLYLLLLLTICWAILMVPMQRSVNKGMTEMMNDMKMEWPKNIIVKNGTVITPENRPYFIKDSKTNETLIVIDTSGKYTQLQDTQAGMLVTKDTVMYWNSSPHGEEMHAVVNKDEDQQAVSIEMMDNNGKMTIEKIPHNLNFQIDPAKVKIVFLQIMDWLWILILPFMLAVSFLYRILESLFYALIGKLFAMLAGVRLLYVDIVKLAMVALTPAIVISTILECFGKWSYHTGLFFMLSVAYIIFAVHANRQGKE